MPRSATAASRATPQVQIWDYTNEKVIKLGADKGSGGLWNNTAGKPGKDPLVKPMERVPHCQVGADDRVAQRHARRRQCHTGKFLG
jgi:hypothetical protein